MFYVDTSVLVSALTLETRTAQMQQWLAGQQADQLTVSDWTITEFSFKFPKHAWKESLALRGVSNGRICALPAGEVG